MSPKTGIPETVVPTMKLGEKLAKKRDIPVVKKAFPNIFKGSSEIFQINIRQTNERKDNSGVLLIMSVI